LCVKFHLKVWPKPGDKVARCEADHSPHLFSDAAALTLFTFQKSQSPVIDTKCQNISVPIFYFFHNFTPIK
jgi:hypothetical protein